jgi:hypothetical protein
MDGPGLRPWEIRRLTIPEVMGYLEDPGTGPRPPENGEPIYSYKDHLEYIARRRAMPILERLQEARAEVQG